VGLNDAGVYVTIEGGTSCLMAVFSVFTYLPISSQTPGPISIGRGLGVVVWCWMGKGEGGRDKEVADCRISRGLLADMGNYFQKQKETLYTPLLNTLFWGEVEMEGLR